MLLLAFHILFSYVLWFYFLNPILISRGEKDKPERCTCLMGVVLYLAFSVLLCSDHRVIMVPPLGLSSTTHFARHTRNHGLWVLCKSNDSKKAWYSFHYLFFASFDVFIIISYSPPPPSLPPLCIPARICKRKWANKNVNSLQGSEELKAICMFF